MAQLWLVICQLSYSGRQWSSYRQKQEKKGSKKKKAGSTAAFVTHSPEMSLNAMSVPTKSVLTLG